MSTDPTELVDALLDMRDTMLLGCDILIAMGIVYEVRPEMMQALQEHKEQIEEMFGEAD